MTFVVAGHAAPHGLKHAVQEEMAHRFDYRTASKHTISTDIFPNAETARRAINYLSRANCRGSPESMLAKEVGGKIYRDDAAEELNLTQEEEVEYLAELHQKAIAQPAKATK